MTSCTPVQTEKFKTCRNGVETPTRILGPVTRKVSDEVTNSVSSRRGTFVSGDDEDGVDRPRMDIRCGCRDFKLDSLGYILVDCVRTPYLFL